MNNFLGLLLAFLYTFLIIGIAEALGRWRGLGNNFTRKFIHIGVGMLSWLVPFLFDYPWPFVLACALFTLLTFLDWRYRFLSSMASDDRSNLGTVYFPIAAAVVALILWDEPPLMVAALMPLTWGDGLASVIGNIYGVNRYNVFGLQRSFEGSITFFIMGGIFTWLALWVMPGNPVVSPQQALAPALVTLLTTTFVEAISPWGIDNLTVTATAIIVLGLWQF